MPAQAAKAGPVRRMPVSERFITPNKETQAMWLIVLEAAGALALFVFLIWWTMFSGRRQGELHGNEPHAAPEPDRDALPPSDHPNERGGSTNEPG